MTLTCGGEAFTATGIQPVSPGFTVVMPWLVSVSASLALSGVRSGLMALRGRPPRPPEMISRHMRAL